MHDVTDRLLCRQIATLDKAQDRRELFIQRDDDKAFVQSLKDQVQAWGQVLQIVQICI